MKRNIIIIACSFLFMSTGWTTPDIAEFKKIIVQVNEFTELEDAGQFMSCFHSRAPAAKKERSNMVSFFKNFDLKYDDPKVELIGLDEDVAVIKVIQNSTAKMTGDFPSKQIETRSLYVLRKETGIWKIWEIVTLDKKYK